MKKTQVLIVGAGFYGLSLGQALYDKGIAQVVVGPSFSLWRDHMIPSMSLRSDRNASEFFTYNGRFNLLFYLKKHEDPKVLESSVPLDVFKRYMNFVESRLTCKRIQSLVSSLKKHKKGFVATLENGKTIFAEQVVIATGIGMHKYLPSSLKPYENDQVLHTYNITKLPSLKNKNILVVGSGQSSAEIIETLYKKNNIMWMQRTKPIWFNEPINLPKFVFDTIINISNFLKYVPYALRQRMNKRFVATTITPKLQYLEKEKTVFIMEKDIQDCNIKKKGTQLIIDGVSYDRVIAATGYKYDLKHFSWIDDLLRKKIMIKELIPTLSASFESSVPDLFFIGGIAEKRQGPGQRFLLGSKYAVKTVMKKIKK